MLPPAAGVFRFGDVELDVLAYTLRRRGRAVRLARQPMELLKLLVEQRGMLVTREQIAAHLWSDDVFVDVDAGIHTAVLKIRQALRDSSHAARYIETIPGKGYRFIAAVSVPSSDSISRQPLHNLPADLTSFVGREKELDEVRALVMAERLVTLAGTGGVGKTRLAVRLGESLVETFRDGVWLVDLGSLSDAALVPQSVAEAIGVRAIAQHSIRDALVQHLRSRELLLVFDTCEHLVLACAELAEALLHGVPRLRILATSRETLGIRGEAVYQVPSLEVPSTEEASLQDLNTFAGTRLFVARACAIVHGFAVSEDARASIVRICRRLDGIPLAIELAAARVSVLSPRQIADRLEDRFRLLTGGARTAVPRQRTLEATVGWSYHLLSSDERHLLDSLGIFPGGFGVDAVEQICGAGFESAPDVLTLLSGLLDKSLVTPDWEHDGTPRYRLLETVRQYARERLADAGRLTALRDAHLSYFHAKYRGAMSVLRGKDQLRCLKQLQAEQEDVRSALEWGLGCRLESAVELSAALFWFWTKQGLFEEGRSWLERAMTVPAPAPVRARLLIGLAHMHYFQGRLSDTQHATDASLALGRQSGDAWVISFALFLRSLTDVERGAYDSAVRYAIEARAAADVSGEAVQHGGPLSVLANISRMRGDYAAARQFYTESIAVHRAAGEFWGLSILLAADAGLRVVSGDFRGAHDLAAEALELSRVLDDARGTAWALEVFAGMFAADGDAEGAARVWGAADGLLDGIGGSLVPTVGWIRDRYFESTRLGLGEAVFDDERRSGRMLPHGQATAFALDRAIHRHKRT